MINHTENNHAENITSLSKALNQQIEIAICNSNYLEIIRLSETLVSQYDRMGKPCEHDATVIMVLYHHAHAYIDMNDCDKARLLLDRALDLAYQKYGKEGEHFYIALIVSAIGWTIYQTDAKLNQINVIMNYFGQAIKIIEKITSGEAKVNYNDIAAIYMKLGLIHASQDNDAEAEKVFHKALNLQIKDVTQTTISPNNVFRINLGTVLNLLGHLKAKTGKFIEAITYYQQAISYFPDSIHLNLAHTYRGLATAYAWKIAAENKRNDEGVTNQQRLSDIHEEYCALIKALAIYQAVPSDEHVESKIAETFALLALNQFDFRESNFVKIHVYALKAAHLYKNLSQIQNAFTVMHDYLGMTSLYFDQKDIDDLRSTLNTMTSSKPKVIEKGKSQPRTRALPALSRSVIVHQLFSAEESITRYLKKGNCDYGIAIRNMSADNQSDVLMFFLMKNGLSQKIINSSSTNRNTALHWTIQKKADLCFMTLLKFNPDYNLLNNDKKTVVDLCLEHSDLVYREKLCNELMQHIQLKYFDCKHFYSSPLFLDTIDLNNTQDINLLITGLKHSGILARSALQLENIKTTDTASIHALVDNLNMQNLEHTLIRAAKAKDYAAINLLMRHKAISIDATDSCTGETALQNSIEAEDLDMIIFLLNNHADTTHLSEQNYNKLQEYAKQNDEILSLLAAKNGFSR